MSRLLIYLTLLEQAYTFLLTLLSHPSSLHFAVLCVRGGNRRGVCRVVWGTLVPTTGLSQTSRNWRLHCCPWQSSHWWWVGSEWLAPQIAYEGYTGSSEMTENWPTGQFNRCSRKNGEVEDTWFAFCTGVACSCSDTNWKCLSRSGPGFESPQSLPRWRSDATKFKRLWGRQERVCIFPPYPGLWGVPLRQKVQTYK